MQSPEASHPRLFVAENQQAVDELLEQLQDKIDVINFQLGLVEQDDDQAIQAISVEAVNELDQQWPYHHHDFAIQGSWYGKGVTVDDAGIKYLDIEKNDAFQTATSDGFGISRREDGTPFVGLGFHAGGFVGGSNHYRFKFDLVTVADPREISMTYVRPPHDFASTLAADARGRLLLYDDLLRLHLSDASEFFRTSRRRQHRFVTNLLDDANNDITAPGATMRAYVKRLKVAYVRTDMSTPYGYDKLTPKPNKKGFKLGGLVLGVTMLEKDILEDHSITSAADLIDPKSGLCLIIDSEQEKVAGKKRPGVILVPVRHIGKMSLQSW